MPSDRSLRKRVALLTGAAGDIGNATVRLMSQRGADIVAIDRLGSDLEGLKAHASAESRLLTIEADVSSERDIQNAVHQAQDELGGIHILFNNAGIEERIASLQDLSLQDFANVLSVNVTGVFLGLKYVIPAMAAQGSGSIINAASVGGMVGSPGLGGFVASKHAVIGLTRVAAIECAHKEH
jgi:NAD(P)-dependent dehydrogenase (short-subunit alcohol dehydrogenase family)